MSFRVQSRGGLGRRARRLTLAPSTASALRPNFSSTPKDDQSTEQRRKEGREELSRMVAMVAEMSPRPRKSHAIPIQSKFWA